MNMDNVVLVRVMNNIPLDGELVPSCEGKRLVNDDKSDFYYFIRNLVKEDLEKNLSRKLIDFVEEDYKILKDGLKKYYVLTGDYYTSTLSFSLNGMVPNDINNDFSGMNIAVIDPIKYHVDDNFVTVNVIDTAIKGNIKVSDEAILLVRREFFLSLSNDIKNNLMNNYKLKLYDGDLKDTINNTLRENSYPVLPLVQKKEMLNILDCTERENMLEFVEKFANMVNSSRLSLQNLTYMFTSGDDVDSIANAKIKEEHSNSLIVDEYYKKQLYMFLLYKAESFNIEITDEDKYNLFTDFIYSRQAMEKIVSCLIDAYGGISKFQSFIQEYNQYVKNNYLTNKQIVSLGDAPGRGI